MHNDETIWACLGENGFCSFKVRWKDGMGWVRSWEEQEILWRRTGLGDRKQECRKHGKGRFTTFTILDVFAQNLQFVQV